MTSGDDGYNKDWLISDILWFLYGKHWNEDCKNASEDELAEARRLADIPNVAASFYWKHYHLETLHPVMTALPESELEANQPFENLFQAEIARKRYHSIEGERIANKLSFLLK